jgi:hypothetical protein
MPSAEVAQAPMQASLDRLQQQARETAAQTRTAEPPQASQHAPPAMGGR